MQPFVLGMTAGLDSKDLQEVGTWPRAKRIRQTRIVEMVRDEQTVAKRPYTVDAEGETGVIVVRSVSKARVSGSSAFSPRVRYPRLKAKAYGSTEVD